MLPLLTPLMLVGALLAQADAPAPAPGDPAGVAVPEAPAGEFRDADALLTALENADATIETFQSSLVYDKLFMLQGDRHTRYGTLSYLVEPPPPGAPPDQPAHRTFAVRFDTLVLDGAQREDRQMWIFDGRWLVEKRFAERQYVAREMARPGSHVDPLRLGEGPLPIPIGQRKADILARYDVELVPMLDAFDQEDRAHRNYMENLAGSTQILLTPLHHRLDDERFESIRLWYRRNAEGLLLPILARTFDQKGDETFVQLTNVRINEPLPENAMEIDPPAPEEGWDVQIERWRADETDGGRGVAPPQDAPPLPQADATKE